MPRPLQLLRDVEWLYPRAATTLAVGVVSVSTTAVARALLPARLRPVGPGWVLPASAGAYLVLRVGQHTGWSKRGKHSILDWFGGDVDDAQTWLLGAVSGGGALVVAELCRRALAGRTG